MPDVKRQALLPKGEENGLAAIARELINDPKRYRAIIAIVDCRRVEVDQDTGMELATIRLRRAEVVLHEDLGAAERLIRRALEFRTGASVLPLELEDEIAQTFAEMEEPESADDPSEPGGPSDDEDGQS